MSSERMGRQLAAAGVMVGYESEYLLRRNWLQLGLMGDCTVAELEVLIDTLSRLTSAPPNGSPVA